MGEKINVIVNRPSPFWLPSMAERDPKTGRPTRAICGKLMLRPGANTIALERWTQTADHPAVKTYVEIGVLKVDASERETDQRSHAPDSVAGIEHLTVVKAAPWIAACNDPEQLVVWRESDARDGIHRLIDKRMAELEPDDELDDEPDDDDDAED